VRAVGGYLEIVVDVERLGVLVWEAELELASAKVVGEANHLTQDPEAVAANHVGWRNVLVRLHSLHIGEEGKGGTKGREQGRQAKVWSGKETERKHRSVLKLKSPRR